MRHLLELAAQALSAEAGPSGLALRVTGHLGCELTEMVLVSERFPIWEHVNVQRGVDAYLAAHAAGAQWFGPAGGGHRPHEDMLSLLSMPPHAVMGWAGSRGSARAVVRVGAGRGGDAVGAASYGTAAVGPEENTEVVSLGLVAAAAPAGAPVVIGIRDESRFGSPFCTLEVLAADREAATATRDKIERLMRAHDVFRGQVLSFTESEHHGNELATFLPRPAVTASDVVLPDGVLEHIERHIIGVADWSAELLGAGQHLKRGLLLHGPPGTGKTHTVRYLTSRLANLTVILLTGRSIRFIDQAAALARRLQPSMVVLEERRSGRHRPRLHPRRESTAVLAAGRDGRGRRGRRRHVLADHQPGRHPGDRARGPARPGGSGGRASRPDARCRERLLRVYARDLTVDADLDQVVAGTEGVTASFIKEMIRRTVLASLPAGERPPVLRGPHFADVLAEMNSEHQALTRSLLGAGAEGPSREPAPRPGPARGSH